MNVVVYLRADDERLLQEHGLDPAAWVRELVRNRIEQVRIDKFDWKPGDLRKEPTRVVADSEDRSVKGRTLAEKFTKQIVDHIHEPGETSATVTTKVTADTTLTAGEATTQVPAAKDARPKPSAPAANADTRQFTPDFKPEAKPKKPRR